MSHISDQMLLQAIREKALNDIKAQHAAQSIINNYGSSGAGSPLGGSAGVGSAMSDAGSGSPGEDPFDYWVDITRKDLPEINEATGKPAGWEKSVHRHRTPKGEGKERHGKK